MDKDYKWRLSPAYDLCFSNEGQCSEHQLLFSEKLGSKITYRDLEKNKKAKVILKGNIQHNYQSSHRYCQYCNKRLRTKKRMADRTCSICHLKYPPPKV